MIRRLWIRWYPALFTWAAAVSIGVLLSIPF